MAACRMSDVFHHHIPVLLEEAVTHLFTIANGVYVDATFGRGSHSRALLDRLGPEGKLIAFDKDPEAVAYARQYFAHDSRFTIIHGSFAGMHESLEKLHVAGKVHGVLFDLGVSSPQLDNPERGFSFSKPGKLDMRMDTTRGIDAMTWLAQVDEKTLADILYRFGEEKLSRRIARAIVDARANSPVTTTAQLADIIRHAMPRPQKPHDKHPATRSFQAIRIAVNQELSDLEAGLQQALHVLAPGGRLAVISFHSLEDRIVKQFIRQHEKGQELPRGLPVKGVRFNARLHSVCKPIKPGPKEIHHNPRARSAILRIAEKLS